MAATAADSPAEDVMQPARILLPFVVLWLGTACASTPRVVTLHADPAAREALLGSWRGSYTIDYRRGGAISFVLVPGENDAHGDVLMTPAGATQPYAPGMRDGLPPAGGPSGGSELLSIRFIRAEDGSVSGMLTPYWDPERTCTAQATFSGKVDGASMTGTFVSTCDRGVPTYTGRWTMRRR
jgi:hypothetical protein